MLWITDETPLPSGKLSVFEASLVTSLLCIGSLFGNFLFVSLSAKFGRRIPLLFLAIPQIVSNTWLDSAKDAINSIESIPTMPIGELVSVLCCNECLLSVCSTIFGGYGWWRCILLGAGLRFRNCRRQVRIRFSLLLSCHLEIIMLMVAARTEYDGFIWQSVHHFAFPHFSHVFLFALIFQRSRHVGLSVNAIV